MPLVESRFSPPVFLRNGHVQTILAAILPRKSTVRYTRERLELPDGDFLDLDWSRQSNSRLIIFCHGLEGSANNSDIRGVVTAANAAGFDALAWNFRGCSGEPNRLPRFYHSGDMGDLGAVIAHAGATYSQIALVGLSLGGNMILKYLGTQVPHPAIMAAVAVSAPIDLASSARALDQRPGNRLYLGRFMKGLKSKIVAKALTFPDLISTTGLEDIRSFATFDDRYTARIHGFRDAEDYWSQSSARQFLHSITVPTLLITAQNDPFLTTDSFPFLEAKSHAHFFFEAPKSGGHLGFLDARGAWLERRLLEFLSPHLQKIPQRAG